VKLYNFLSKKVEEFTPIKTGEVGLYTCGPTVYDYVHFGNWRTFVFEDVLERALGSNGLNVYRVMNITDIEDKIIKKANEEKVDFKEITKKYEKAFFDDLVKLNIILEPDEPKELGEIAIRHYPRATEYVDEMIALIQRLLDKGVAYKAEDGVYYSVEKFKGYGKLSGLSKGNLKKGARVNDDLYDKEAWSDFALWKFPSSAKVTEGEPSWEAPFGRGRPGWHIECSAMSMALLGESFDLSGKLRVNGEHGRTIDIHTGGVDLLFPHHENEIAQSEAAIGKKFVEVWMEGEHLLVDGQKMSKSLKNFYKLEDIIVKGFDPIALRYLFLTAHYRSKLNFTWKSLEAAANALNNLREEISNWEDPGKSGWVGCAEFENNFKEAINDDLDMPGAIAVMWDLVKSDLPTKPKHQSIFLMDRVLGLGLDEVKKAELPDGAKELIGKREELRKSGKFEESDKLRQELLDMGVEVEDTPLGPKWKVNPSIDSGRGK